VRSIPSWITGILFPRIGSRRSSRAKCLDKSFTIFPYVGKFFPNFGREILEKDGERKLSKMKKQNPLTKLTLLFAVLLTLGAARAQADILPAVSIGFSPVGLTMDQTARLNLVNLDVPNGIFINWGFIDANGVTLARSAVTLPLGKIVSVDFMRQMGPGSVYVRAEVRVQVDILTPNVPGESLRRSLEVFNNDTGATTVCLGGGGL
jgi:hypothetical protein